MQVVCRSLPELEYYLFLSIPSHTVEALDFKSKVEPGNKREGNEISEKSEARTSLGCGCAFSCRFAKSSISKGLQTVAHLAAIHLYQCAFSCFDKIFFFQRIGMIKYFGMLLQL